MSEPVTAAVGILSGKAVAIFYALGGALLTLAFYEPVEKTRTRLQMFMVSLANVAMSWFSGYVIGGAVNEYFALQGQIANSIYSLSAIIGLILVGTIYRVAQKFRDDPENTIRRWLGKK